jgi:hypothetical protein
MPLGWKGEDNQYKDSIVILSDLRVRIEEEGLRYFNS